MSKTIVYGTMTQNRLSETKKCVEIVEPYVDHIVIIDGGSIDDSVFYFRNWSQENPKIKFFLHPWKDNFPAQRTNYINRAREVVGHDDFWILVSDPDEWFEKETMENLQDAVVFAEQNGCNMVCFQCRSASFKGDKRVWESLDNYWKGLLFKYMPGLHYVGNPHETLMMPGGLRQLSTPFIYEHIKQENIIWHRGIRNLYCGGGGPNLGDRNPLWKELKDTVKEVYGRELTWHEFDKEMLRGNLDARIKNWLFKAKDQTGYDGASEHREGYKLYFRIYHPEEEPAEFVGKGIE